MLNRFPGWKPGGKTPLVFFPNLLDAKIQQALPAAFRPQKTFAGDECVLDADFLSKFLQARTPT